MPTRRLVQPIPACRAKTELLKWTENYLRQKAADLTGTGEYGVLFKVTVQDSWGSLETDSVEQVTLPLAGDVERIRFELICYEQAEEPHDSGDEYFTVSVVFANHPALAVCQMRLTGDTAVTLVNGMWADIKQQIEKYPVKGFVRRVRAGWLVAFLVVGIALSVGIALLFAFGLFSAATIGLAASGLVLGYTLCSWRLPHCVFDTVENEHRLDWNKRFWWAVGTSVGFAVAVRLALKHGFGL